MKEVRWGIIGCGSVAEYKGGPALYNAPDSKLIAVMGRDGQKAKGFMERHHARRYYTSVGDLFADSEIDAVYIATPPNVHAELTLAAAGAGKHVLCEKPMAMNLKECDEMIAACKANNVQLMIAYYRRFYPVVNKMKEVLDRGGIGQPVYGRVLCSARYVPAGKQNWRMMPDVAGGGFLADIGSHRLDLLLHFFGNPESVSAVCETNYFDIKVDDSTTTFLRFKSGAHAAAQFYWSMATGLDEFDVGGTEGRLFCRNLEKGELEITTSAGQEKLTLPRPQITHLHLVENFVKSILAGKGNALPGEEGRKTNRIIQAVYDSQRSSSRIAFT